MNAAEAASLRNQVSCQNVVTALRAGDAMEVQYQGKGAWILISWWRAHRLNVSQRQARNCIKSVFGPNVAIRSIFGL
jgi:hypothetical protein